MLMMLSSITFTYSMTLILSKNMFFIKWNIISLMNMNFELNFLFDWMSLMFMSVVLFISSMVMMYSKEYMILEIKKSYFIMILMLFVISMILMIMSPNMLSIILGWDGLGLISYCLIIYYQSSNSFNSGMLTLMTNRIGDVMLLIMIFLMMNLNSWNLKYYFINNMTLPMILLMMLMTKSAQIPFSMWLPAAMAAPTPVSSLVHSSTLVTAGIYILIRFNTIFTNLTLPILIIGLITLLLASINAIFEFDLKKIIAFSTLSQLGLMMNMLAYQLPNYVFFHLISHAMFKSLLFLCSGIMIHFMINTQDIRSMGSLLYESPLVIMFFNYSNLSLSGFPFLSGYYSKDLIFEMTLNYLINPVIMILMYISISLTMIYSFRLMFYLTFNTPSHTPMIMKKDNFLMNFSIFMLFLMTVIFGNMINWLSFNSVTLSILNLEKKTFIYTSMIMSMLFFLSMITYLSNMKLKFLPLTFNMMNFMYLNKLTFSLNHLLINYTNKLFYLNETMWNEFYSKLMFNFLFNSQKNFLMKYFLNNLMTLFLMLLFILILIISLS
uniref:NADH-ubiquinone oxidoreductase chain 5 n=1 Tax=Leptopilina myrica (nomen nudum) TaxID=2964900 RepID=A0AAU7BNJ2_9HYME